MSTDQIHFSSEELAPFDRDFLKSKTNIALIGSGSIGGKASGLAYAENALAAHFRDNRISNITLGIPRFVVIATDFFDEFLDLNDLRETAASDMSDDYIAHSFEAGRLPDKLAENLRLLAAQSETPLAVRSSSLLEDAMYEPFAGVYATKMIPNHTTDAAMRFEKIAAAVKFVYASTFFSHAKSYHRAIGRSTDEEKMAVMIQEVVGRRHGDRFYPDVSGVARSYNFYPVGYAKPENGVVSLALGLGKTIVDGGLVWSYSPAYPRVNPPVASAGELLKMSQNEFWAINMGPPAATNPLSDTEYLTRAGLSEAGEDGTLRFVASTYHAQDDRIVTGLRSSGPPIITFAPILLADQIPLNDLVMEMLDICENVFQSKVEVEFAVSISAADEISAHFGFLQVRPMVVSDAVVDLTPEEMAGDDVLVASEKSLGNGVTESIEDVIYIDPDNFEAKYTKSIAAELSDFNRRMLESGRPYILIGFGRWGSSDPWLGIPVSWGQISGVRALVEATLPGMDVDLSQGAHFFHNMTSFRICYFAVPYNGRYGINWDWLKKQELSGQGEFVRHVHTSEKMQIKVDGRTGRGVIRL